MTAQLVALGIDANDPETLARFWSGVLGWRIVRDPTGGTTLVPRDDTGFSIRFLHSPDRKSGPNWLHLHLTSSSLEHRQQTIDRSIALGGRHLDVGQLPEEQHVVLADPEGNEFCVIEPGNNWLADCGFLGELTCDGSRDVGFFWSDALGWPLVWDQDQETAIRSPHGGPKISWGGPPLRVKTGRDRLQFHLAAPPGVDPESEVDRLVSRGATRIGIRHDDVRRLEMADPDGHEFCFVIPDEA